jgi:hypothetical protein
MDYDRRSNGWITFLEHYWFFVIAVTALIGSQALAFITRLTGTPWICCYAVALLVSAVGVALLFYAKLPLYRQHRFFTFGSEAIPESRRSFYRGGYRCLIFAVLLFLLLLLSRP